MEKELFRDDSGRFKKGVPSWSKGKKFTLEHRLNISKAKKKSPTKYWLGKKRPEITGKNHPNWKQNPKTDESKLERKRTKYIEWRKAVFERDNYTCQECFQRGSTLNPHHIKSFAEFPKLRYKLSNGITLCLSCHKKTHNYARNVKKSN